MDHHCKPVLRTRLQYVDHSLEFNIKDWKNQFNYNYRRKIVLASHQSQF